jgi:hypothetical protein
VKAEVLAAKLSLSAVRTNAAHFAFAFSLADAGYSRSPRPIRETVGPGELRPEHFRGRVFLFGRTPANGEKLVRAFRAEFQTTQPSNQADPWNPSPQSNTRKH